MDAIKQTLTQRTLIWGHNFKNYQAMFNLNENDLNKPILDYFPGPASFIAELRALGKYGVAVDELYQLNAENIQKRCQDVLQSLYKKIEQDPQRFDLNAMGSLDDFKRNREDAIEIFLNDFVHGIENQHYLKQLPLVKLPPFHLALCSHYCFSHRFSEELTPHLLLVETLLQQANEIRIFPLLDSRGDLSHLVGPLILNCQQNDLGVEVREVSYQFQKGGNALLRIWKKTCELGKKEK